MEFCTTLQYLPNLQANHNPALGNMEWLVETNLCQKHIAQLECRHPYVKAYSLL